jgi:hypothetical protein
MRRTVKFITAVWGESYIEAFAALSLPSFLAPANLPALAQASDLEVVILTRREDVDTFEQYPIFRRLRATCAVHFIHIDDLITTGLYGITLTLAYARAVIACGRQMLDTHFVFMNADFVLADGSLRSLVNHINAGRSIVLGPSFRATAEALEPRLLAEVDAASGTLVMSPRNMARLALAHPHPTTIAKTVNQQLCHSIHPNQLFWQVDENTVLGRYYLIFMLCLKPERMITSINSFCDYAFIPEMCPSGDEVIMADSDEFFMLELQRRDQEAFLLRVGKPSEKTVARRLKHWTTAEHRRAAGYDVVFHAENIPPSIEGAKTEARIFIDRLNRALGPPLSHRGHWHWLGSVDAFIRFRKMQGHGTLPSELAPVPAVFRARGSVRRLTLRAALSVRHAALAASNITMGRPPKVTILNPSWLDYRHLRKTLRSLLQSSNMQLLIVQKTPGLIEGLLPPDSGVRLATFRDVRFRATGQRHEWKACSDVLVYATRDDLPTLSNLLDECNRALGRPGTIFHVFVQDLGGRRGRRSFATELIELLNPALGWPPRSLPVSFVGGSMKRVSQKLLVQARFHFERFGALAVFWTLPAAVAALPIALLTNLYKALRPFNTSVVQHCSSILIRFDAAEMSCEVKPSAEVPEAARA